MLTKPAGVFLQLLAIPFLIYGCVEGLNGHSWWGLVVGLALLFWGGTAARQKNTD